MSRWLGLDHGSRRIGVAVGDTVSGLAGPVGRLDGGDPQLFDRIREFAQDYGAVGIVVGWPINADGTEGPQGRLARAFAWELASRLGVDVRLWDERLSSFEADGRLAGTMSRLQRRRRQDAVAAGAFLEDFLAAGSDAAVKPSPPEQDPPATRWARKEGED